MADSNTAALAGEFLVAGELSRRGYLVSITMGNAKAIDILACTRDRKTTIKIDVKASRYKTSWPIGHIKEDLYYIFVYLQDKNKLTNERGKGTNTPPEYFIVRGEDIVKKKLLCLWKNMSGIKYSSLHQYKERWNILPQP